jgi:hypothetical protein
MMSKRFCRLVRKVVTQEGQDTMQMNTSNLADTFKSSRLTALIIVDIFLY